MTPALIYTISIVGAAALYLLLRRPSPGGHDRPLKAIGALVGLAAVAWMIVEIGRHLSPADEGRPEAFYTVFTLIALASAVRMITHHRPVYCALYFVLVVLASAGMFLLLAAEFMAFALIIVYAGAILITYMFVLMLAQQAESPDDVSGGGGRGPEYDRVPREPGLAVVTGFLLLALLSNVIFMGVPELDHPPTTREALQRQIADLQLMPRELQEAVDRLLPGAQVALDEAGRAMPFVERDGAPHARVRLAGETEITELELAEDAAPTNIKRVGLALVAKFPVSLELAGIILLLAMFGAVVLARRQIELSEDELRDAAGLRRLSEDDEQERGSRAEGNSGA